MMILGRDSVLLIAALVVVPACLSGCESTEGCTDVGCGAALRVELVGGASEVGAYELTVTADGVTTICTATLPFASCESAVSCDRTDPGFWVTHSGCALSADQHRLDGLEWAADGPEQVTVEVRRDGTLLGSSTATPTYRTSYPNGEDCGPVCEQADQPLTVSL